MVDLRIKNENVEMVGWKILFDVILLNIKKSSIILESLSVGVCVGREIVFKALQIFALE